MSDPVDVAFEILSSRAGGRARRDAPIGPLTSYQLGGPAAVLLDAESASDLEALADALERSGLEPLIVGRGSNMLVSDRGFGGIAVRLGAGFRWSEVAGRRLSAGAAVPVPALATLASDHRLTGFEFAVAIPASLGGAVRMNAGAHGHSIGGVLDHARFYDLARREEISLPASALGFAYRSTDLPPRSVVTGATLALRPGDPASIEAAMRAARDWRRATQPIGLPNAGSVFTNPPDLSAGRLVEEICGKGMRVGGARVSEVHANFIVTDVGASADDVYTLIRRIQRMVSEHAGVRLEPEVRLVGEFREVEDGASAR